MQGAERATTGCREISRQLVENQQSRDSIDLARWGTDDTTARQCLDPTQRLATVRTVRRRLGRESSGYRLT